MCRTNDGFGKEGCKGATRGRCGAIMRSVLAIIFAGVIAGAQTPVTTPKIVAASGSSFVVSPDGTVRACGANGSGQLGLGDQVARSTLALIPGLSGVTALVSGDLHTFALLADGTVMAWGSNNFGQLGLGYQTTVYPWCIPTPTLVPGLANVTALSAGWGFSLALLANGSVMSFGNNNFGQLGHGDYLPRSTPTPVPGLSNVHAVSACEQASYAVLTNGNVMAWGAWSGLGIGVTTQQPSPQLMPNLAGVTALSSACRHKLALLSNGTVMAWGENANGQLGLGYSTPYGVGVDTPTLIPGLAGVTAVSAGSYFSLALLADGTVRSWGNNSKAQLGLGSNVPVGYSTAQPVPGLAGVLAVSAGGEHALALLSDGSVRSWGWETYGQTGLGRSAHLMTPHSIPGIAGVSTLAAGNQHSLAVLTNGSVMAWGQNFNGQLGLGSSGAGTSQPTPQLLAGLAGAAAVAAGAGHSLALLTSGAVATCGSNTVGQLGLGTSGAGTDQSTFQVVPGLAGVVAVSTAQDHSLALMTGGTVAAWGRNTNGQLGLGNTVAQSSPQTIPGLSGVIAIATGERHALALLSGGTVMAWGKNDYGQLGLGNTLQQTAPQPVPGLSGVTALAAGFYHSLALLGDGTLMAWGRNNQGQLGNGTSGPGTDSFTPQPVAGLTGVAAITTRGHYSLALLTNGTVMAWGKNDIGQLGLGYTNSGNVAPYGVNTPTLIPGLTGVTAVRTGLEHTLVLLSDGTMKSWGRRDYGAPGIGYFDMQPTPETIPGLCLGAVPTYSLQFTMLGTAATGISIPCNSEVGAGHFYFNAFGIDPANASSPGTGTWYGLHITQAEVLTWFDAGANGLSLAFGPLSATGAATASIAVPVAQLAGLTLYGVSIAVNPLTWQVVADSNIASHTF